MKKNTIIVIFILCLNTVFGQNINNVWYFGDGNFLDFNFPTPVISSAGTQNATSTTTYCIEGTSAMCDNSGQLLFYSDGILVWDKNYNLMPNGNGLNGHSSDAQVLIVPNPGNSNLYYVFYADFAGNSNGFSYSEIDMNLNAGLGDVTALKNIQLHTPSAEMMKATTHCNGTDIWVLSHDALGNTFRAYLVTASGVNSTAVVSNVGTPFPNVFTGASYMTCRKDGKKIAINVDTAFEIFDFDNQNGILCPPITVQTGGISGGYGIEYSEDGTKLYVSDYLLNQFNVTSNNPSTIALSKATYNVTEPAAIMRGPDNKIYIAGGCDYYDTQTSTMYYARNIHVIQNPNLSGVVASNLQLNVYTTPRECGLGLPTCYYPTQTTNTCGAVLTANASVSNTNNCVNDCVSYTNLSLGPAVSYNWTFQGGTPSSFSGLTPPQVCYSTSGNFTTTLVIADCSGNISSFNLNINVGNCSSPIASFIVSQTNLCIGDCINFTDNSTGNNINTWNWTFSGGIPSSYNGQNPSPICFNTSGTFSINLSIVDDFGSDDTTITINVAACNPPIADFTASDNEICEGDCISFSDLSVGANSWNWVFTGGTPTYSSSQNPQNVCFNTNGVYTIELTAGNNFGTDTKTSNVIVHENPVISLGQDISIQEDEEITLIATGSSGFFVWSPEDVFNCSNCNSQTFFPDGDMTVQVTVTDANGCTASDEININVEKEYEIFIPNAFTPSDDGLNELFGPVCDFEIENYQLVIYNRWGETIFESHYQQNNWNGKINNQLVPSGIYVWRLVGRNGINYTNIRETGHVLVLY